jgi:hypothetical protein
VAETRVGWKLIHTAPPGASVKWFEAMHAFVVAGGDTRPYLVFPDGRTEMIQWARK